MRAMYPVRNSHALFPLPSDNYSKERRKSVCLLHFPLGAARRDRRTARLSHTLSADLSHAEGEMPRASFDFPCHVRWVIKEGKSESSSERRRE